MVRHRIPITAHAPGDMEVASLYTSTNGPQHRQEPMSLLAKTTKNDFLVEEQQVRNGWGVVGWEEVGVGRRGATI